MKPLTNLERDALKEIGSIGAGHASTALSIMINKRVEVNMLHLDKMLVKDIPKLLDGNSTQAVGIAFGIRGDVPGRIVMLSTKDTALRLAELLQEKKKGTVKNIDTMSRSALKEMGNILIGSYLSALSDFSGLNMLETTPILIISNADKVMEKSVSSYKELVDFVLVIEAKLKIDTEKFIEDLILILRPDTFEAIFNSIVEKTDVGS